MKKKILGVVDFFSENKRVESYSDFGKFVHLIQHGLQAFIVKNIEGESTEANDLSHLEKQKNDLWLKVCLNRAFDYQSVVFNE